MCFGERLASIKNTECLNCRVVKSCIRTYQQNNNMNNKLFLITIKSFYPFINFKSLSRINKLKMKGIILTSSHLHIDKRRKKGDENNGYKQSN